MNPELKILGFQKSAQVADHSPSQEVLRLILRIFLFIQKEKEILDPRMMAAKILEWKTLKLCLSHYHQKYILSIDSE